MLPGIMLAVALTTDPAIVSAWPVSEADAELAATEAVLRNRIAECFKGIEYFEGQRTMYQERLKSNGGSTEHERKMLGFFARRLDECKTECSEACDQVKEVQRRREQKRKPRTESQNEKK